MSAVVIVSKNQDFTEVAAGLIRKETGISAQVAESKEQLQEWPDALVITDDNLPLRIQDVLGKVHRYMQNRKADEKIDIAGFELSTRLKTLSHDGGILTLTDKEVQLLMCLSETGKAGIDREELLKRVWGFEPDINTHTLETHIYRLRTKLRELAGDALSIEITDGAYKLGVKA